MTKTREPTTSGNGPTGLPVATASSTSPGRFSDRGAGLTPPHRLGDRHPLQDNRVVQRVVELVRLQYAGRREHVACLRDGVRVRGAVRVAARGCADTKQEILRSRREAARLIVIDREPILPVENNGECPAGAGSPAEARLRNTEGDVAGDLVRADRRNGPRLRLGDRHPLQDNRMVQRVVELVRLQHAGRREHV